MEVIIIKSLASQILPHFTKVSSVNKLLRYEHTHCAKKPTKRQVTTMLATSHPELSGCITTLTVRNTNFCAAMDALIDQDGHL